MHAVAFAPGGSIVAWGGTGGTVHLGDLGLTARGESDLACLDSVTTLLFDRSGHRLVCAGDSQIVEVWDLDAVNGSPSFTVIQIGLPMWP